VKGKRGLFISAECGGRKVFLPEEKRSFEAKLDPEKEGEPHVTISYKGVKGLGVPNSRRKKSH